jgi:hypothetical protein
MTEIQSIYFMSPPWTTTTARAWLRKEKHTPIKRVHKNGHELRYRMTEPKQYKRFRTKKFNDGVYFVYGIK